MSMNYHGHGTANVVDYLSDAQTLPNATAVDSTQMVEVGGKTNNKLKVYVYANNAVEIATGQAFKITVEAFTADTAASATDIFSYDNSGTQTLVPGHYDIYTKTSADDAAAWAAGELITEWVVSEELLNLMSYDFIQLKYTTDADESADKVDAWVEVIRP